MIGTTLFLYLADNRLSDSLYIFCCGRNLKIIAFSFLADKAVRAKKKKRMKSRQGYCITSHCSFNKDPQYIQNYSTKPICNDDAFIHTENNDDFQVLSFDCVLECVKLITLRSG